MGYSGSIIGSSHVIGNQSELHNVYINFRIPITMSVLLKIMNIVTIVRIIAIIPVRFLYFGASALVVKNDKTNNASSDIKYMLI